MRSVGKPSAPSSRVAATSAGSSPFGVPYFTFACVPSANVQTNFGVDPPTGSSRKSQSTSAAPSKAPGPGVLRARSTCDGGTRGGSHTRARASASSRTMDTVDAAFLAVGASALSLRHAGMTAANTMATPANRTLFVSGLSVGL
jgi:hypothetical protein